MPRHDGRDNLIPNSERTPEELREMTRKAGIRSGEVRREKKRMATLYAEVLEKKYEVKLDGLKKTITGRELVEQAIMNILSRGDSSTVSLIKELREGTDGNKVELSGNPFVIEIVSAKNESGSE